MVSYNYANIVSILTKSRNILLITHENPDGDAIASVGAMYEYLNTDDKQVSIFCKNYPEKSFEFLPHTEKFNTNSDLINFNELDAVVVLDCANINRTGLADILNSVKCPLINIDHHISNNDFGTVNCIDAEAVATTQILYNFFSSQKININKNIANCILTGIVTDSGNFAYAASNSHTFTIAGEMLMRGANARNIVTYTSRNKKLATLKVWGLALSRLSYNKKRDIVYTILTQNDLKNFGITKDDLEGLSNFLNTLKDAKIVMVLYELGDGRIKGSLRTTRSDVDVSRFASYLGGGGHKKAAGFEIHGKLEQINGVWKVL